MIHIYYFIQESPISIYSFLRCSLNYWFLSKKIKADLGLFSHHITNWSFPTSFNKFPIFNLNTFPSDSVGYPSSPAPSPRRSCILIPIAEFPSSGYFVLVLVNPSLGQDTLFVVQGSNFLIWEMSESANIETWFFSFSTWITFLPQNQLLSSASAAFFYILRFIIPCFFPFKMSFSALEHDLWKREKFLWFFHIIKNLLCYYLKFYILVRLLTNLFSWSRIWLLLVIHKIPRCLLHTKKTSNHILKPKRFSFFIQI